LLGAVFIFLALNTPTENRNQFFVFMCLTAIFMPLSSANVIATVYDVTVPEVRSTAQAVEYFIENAGAAFAPILTGLIADAIDLKTAILLICTVAWGLCFLFYIGAIFTIDGDSHNLREQMTERAKSMNAN
ncbi:MAG: MFS transporter, partial [Chloroflexi bacterium CFX2]|nr:MFS transporter [Chloroflexi bacterium CFX2]